MKRITKDDLVLLNRALDQKPELRDAVRLAMDFVSVNQKDEMKGRPPIKSPERRREKMIIDWLMDNPGKHSLAGIREGIGHEAGLEYIRAVAAVVRNQEVQTEGEGQSRRYWCRLKR